MKDYLKMKIIQQFLITLSLLCVCLCVKCHALANFARDRAGVGRAPKDLYVAFRDFAVKTQVINLKKR